ncbi:MAG TPA: hypothetical protein VLV17_05735 [Anaeromyxobacteraceae bacterium]|nr:hypothetical protein [Anaeromyxobacteraceae bacterium]
MLAYVFWHWPAARVDPTRYEKALLAFHGSLAAERIPGLRGSRIFEVKGAPFLPVGYAFEDWYFVDDFAALGVLNERAASGSCAESHHAVAAEADGGTGGVYRQLSAGVRPPGSVTWLKKPSGLSYRDFRARLPPGELWQRQMTLGPAPEFCLFEAELPEGLCGARLVLRRVHP